MTPSLPEPEHPVWRELAAGRLQGFTTRHLALQLLLKQLVEEGAQPEESARRLQVFFGKYARVLREEISQLRSSC